MAQADGGGVLPRDRSGSGAALLSAVLHVGAAAALIAFQVSPRLDETPDSLPIEIILEAPAPPPAPAVADPAPPPVVAKPVVREAAPVRPKPIQAARPAAPMATPVALPPVPGETKGEATEQPPPPVQQAAQPVAAPSPAVDTVDYGAYVGRLHERIARHRVYPPQAMRRREEGDVRLRILLAGDGSLVDILSLAEASAPLTQAARAAIESAAPFDPPPRGGGGERRLAFDVTVAFRLR